MYTLSILDPQKIKKPVVYQISNSKKSLISSLFPFINGGIVSIVSFNGDFFCEKHALLMIVQYLLILCHQFQWPLTWQLYFSLLLQFRYSKTSFEGNLVHLENISCYTRGIGNIIKIQNKNEWIHLHKHRTWLTNKLRGAKLRIMHTKREPWVHEFIIY